MRIILIRHGRSAGNEDDAAYAQYGDPLVPLVEEGWRQAYAAGKFLGRWFESRRPASGEIQPWPRLWVSSFLRPQQTTSGLLAGIGDGILAGRPPDPREDPRLAEQSFGFLPYVKGQQGGNKAIADALAEFSHAVYKGNPFMAQPPLGEAPITSYSQADDFIETLFRDSRRGVEDHLIVTHGAKIKGILMRWFHLPMTAWKALETPRNCDILVIEKEKGEWQVRKIYDGENKIAVDIDPLAGIQRLTLETLPPLPDFLKKKEL